MEITYVYDPEVETYRRIVEEHETSYLISNFLGAKYSIDKPENPDLITLTIAPVEPKFTTLNIRYTELLINSISMIGNNHVECVGTTHATISNHGLKWNILFR